MGSASRGVERFLSFIGYPLPSWIVSSDRIELTNVAAEPLAPFCDRRCACSRPPGFVRRSDVLQRVVSVACRFAKAGWKADVLNGDDVPEDQIYSMVKISVSTVEMRWRFAAFRFYLRRYSRTMSFTSACTCDALRAGAEQPCPHVSAYLRRGTPARRLGKKIVYSNKSCNDGVSQTSFRSWTSPPVCDICKWRDVPWVCSDEVNLAWGKVRNELADYQCTLGGNRKDYNDDPRVHEVPEFYCLDPELWRPDLQIRGFCSRAGPTW